MKRISINELFSGIGSQRKALLNLGFNVDVIGISEIDKYAIKSYEAIFGETRNYGDISKVDKLDYADLWTYSFPCTDISTAGKMEGLNENTRSGLLYQVQRLLDIADNNDTLPKYLLLENVKNLVGSKFKKDFNEWLEYLSKLGYNNYWQVLNAKDYGIPQNRERVFVVSIRKDIQQTYTFPLKKELNIKLKDILEDDVDEKFYLNDNKTSILLKQAKEKLPNYQLDNKINTCLLSNQATKIEKFSDIACTLMARDYKGFGNQRGNGVIISDDKIICERRCDEGLRFFKNNICGTLRTIDSCGDKRIIENKSRIRKLTPKECWRLMGFRDEDIDKAQAVSISNTQLYKQAGNSIVVDVLECIFRNLLGE